MTREICCEGWWEQTPWGRQPMEQLWLTFNDGNLGGRGMDVVGPFTLVGTIENGQVTISKQYTGKHLVEYVGEFDGEGSMQGTWHIASLTGRWAIRVSPNASTGGDDEIERIVPE